MYVSRVCELASIFWQHIHDYNCRFRTPYTNSFCPWNMIFSIIIEILDFFGGRSLLLTNYWERDNLLNPFPPSRIESQRTYKGRLSLSIISGQRRFMTLCGFYMADEYATLAQKTLKANYWENHFAVTIGVGLTTWDREVEIERGTHTQHQSDANTVYWNTMISCSL